MGQAHDTLIDWCIGRGWPLNWMTVISAWWRSNMPFQRLSGRLSGWLNYYIGQCRQEVRRVGAGWVGVQTSWRKVVVGKTATRPKGPSGPAVSLETRWWRDVVKKAIIQQRAGPLGLRLSSPGERVRHNADGHKSRGQYIAVIIIQSPTPSHSKTLSNLSNKVRGIFFLKKSSLVFIIVSLWFFLHVLACVYVDESAYEYITRRLADKYWRRKDELISDILLCSPTHGQACDSRPAETYVHQLCANRGFNIVDLSWPMGDKDGCRERVREIRAVNMNWWWWWWWWWYVQVMFVSLGFMAYQPLKVI